MADELSYEPHGMSPDTMKILTGYGHKFSAVPENRIRRNNDRRKGNRIGAIDSGSDGEATGY